MTTRRALGLLYLAAGILPLIAVANPALFDMWAAEPPCSCFDAEASTCGQ